MASGDQFRYTSPVFDSPVINASSRSDLGELGALGFEVFDSSDL